jgi:hypothetical protein
MTGLRKLLKTIYLLAQMAFTVWFGLFMYPLIFGFEGKEQAALSLRVMGESGTGGENVLIRLLVDEPKLKRTDLGYDVIEQPYIKGHFHHIGFEIQEDKADVCSLCHGDTPHHLNPELRSFLNMHAFFLSCQVCHADREEGGSPPGFRWYDKETGEQTGSPAALARVDQVRRRGLTGAKYPTFGDYGAKIGPEKRTHLQDDRTRDFALATQFQAQQASLSAQQKSQITRGLHRSVAKRSVQCDGCHRPVDAYLPLAELGYPPRRIDDLTHDAVVGIVGKYRRFYLPGVLTGGPDG